MRSRILRVAITSIVIAVLVLGIPLALAISRLVRADERSALERLALTAAVRVSPAALGGDPIELPAVGSGQQIAVYDAHGQRIDGTGPTVLDPGARSTLAGHPVAGTLGSTLVAVVPVSSRERVVGVVRAAEDVSQVRAITWRWYLGLAGGCVAAVLLASVFAAFESRRLAEPLERLALTAQHLGEDGAAEPPSTSGVGEIDAVDKALRETGQRLADTLERERAFSAQASHQLRTPLTRLRLDLERGLETGGQALVAAAGSAMETTEQLSATIDDVLALARGETTTEGFQVEALLQDCQERWREPLAAAGRPLRVQIQDPLYAQAALPAARQVMHVLIDNALRHGRGTVILRARESHGAAALDVIDEGDGPPISIDADAQIGLSLAKRLLLTEGGRLLVDQRGPGTRFTMLLPLGHASADRS